MKGGQDKCIFVQIHDGLGNQLFIYAAGLVAKKKLGIPLCLLPATDSIHTHRDYRKVLFKDSKAVNPSDSGIKQRIEKSTVLFSNLKGTYEKWSNSNIPGDLPPGDVILNPKAYFQNYSAIHGIIDDLRKEIIGSLESMFIDIKKSVHPGSSAFMHVRRGDFMKVEGQVLSRDYYQNALDEICKLDGLKTLFIISNDIDWCKEQGFHVGSEIAIEWVDDPDELKVFYLMCLCERGAILSASTFSAWGAIMGAQKHKDPKIIYPKRWWMHDNSSVLEFPEDKGWTRI
jgi:hypothetical protein